jgi:hypothetical protein
LAVRTGLTDGSFTEIVSGDVNEGDEVVLEATNSDDPAAGSAKPAAGGNQPPRMRL